MNTIPSTWKFGLDVSYYQDGMNYAQAHNNGCEWVMFRIGSISLVTGQPYEDYRFHENALSAPKIMPSGGYWYARMGSAGYIESQVDFIVPLMRQYLNAPGTKWIKYPINIDYEVPGRAEQVRLMYDLLEAEFPGKVSLYSNWNTLIYKTTGNLALLYGIPLHLADWTAPYPTPPGFQNVIALQYGVFPDAQYWGAGSINGKPVEKIDHNYADPVKFFVQEEPPSPEDLEEFVVELAGRVLTIQGIVEAHEDRIDELEAEVSLLRGELANSQDFAYIEAKIGGESGDDALIYYCRLPNATDKALKPWVRIYPSDSKDDQGERWHVEGRVKVFPIPVKVTGGDDYRILLGDRGREFLLATGYMPLLREVDLVQA